MQEQTNLELRDIQKYYQLAQKVKRLADFVLSLIGIVILSPLLGAITLWIKLDSQGPIFFTRHLIGFQRQKFLVYKFRTMVQNAHELMNENAELLCEYQETLKISNDPRITKAGRILRKTSLDELPQLFNILRGDMSLVGPRILGDVELARYGDAQETILSVRPGLTGLWQVSGRHQVTFEKRMELDLCYIDHWNLWLDLKILLKTIPAVISGQGAE